MKNNAIDGAFTCRLIFQDIRLIDWKIFYFLLQCHLQCLLHTSGLQCTPTLYLRFFFRHQNNLNFSNIYHTYWDMTLCMLKILEKMWKCTGRKQLQSCIFEILSTRFLQNAILCQKFYGLLIADDVLLSPQESIKFVYLCND